MFKSGSPLVLLQSGPGQSPREELWLGWGNCSQPPSLSTHQACPKLQARAEIGEADGPRVVAQSRGPQCGPLVPTELKITIQLGTLCFTDPFRGRLGSFERWKHKD